MPQSYSEAPITYDADGNVTAFTPSGGSTSTHAWEHRSRMKQQVAGGTTYNYLYNALGHRAARTAPGTRFYIFAGDILIGELNGATPEVAYTHGPDGLISKRALTGTPSSRWYHFGPQGETRQLTNSAGTITDTYSYNAYGSLLSSTGSTTNPYRYGGKYGYYTEGAANLMLATHRWYSPDLMRWMSRDPIEYEGGENLYEYVGSDPINFVDPTGYEPEITVPLAPPGVDIIKNLKEAQTHFGDAAWFYKQVNDQGPWDYKLLDPKYENFGNFNYGVCGRAVGFSVETLKRAAGAAQWKSRTSKPEWGTPLGGFPYGDDPKDQRYIQSGIDYYEQIINGKLENVK